MSVDFEAGITNYHDNGIIKSITYYKFGFQYIELFNTEGYLCAIENYYFDKLHGQQLKYYKNGRVRSILNYEYGELHGHAKTYYENGNIKLRLQWYHNKKYGIFTKYSMNWRILHLEYEYYENHIIGTAIEYYDNYRTVDYYLLTGERTDWKTFSADYRAKIKSLEYELIDIVCHPDNIERLLGKQGWSIA